MDKIAKEYRNYGLACLPVQKNKQPAIKETWKDGVREWSKYKGAWGIGVICGKISGGLECMDFDNHFSDARDNLISFIDQIKELNNKYHFTVEVTQNQGYHLLYRCKTISGNTKLASKPKLENDKWRPDAIIETRGEGGYFVAAPSPNYIIKKGSLLDIPEITSEERKLMFEVAKGFNTWFDVKKEIHEEKDKPGDMFNNDVSATNEMKDVLKDLGWTEDRKNKWRRPGKKEGISASISEGTPGIFYNFSQNAYPFLADKGYSPFQVIGLLKYQGDFKRFAEDLSKRYNVEKPVKKDWSKKEPEKFDTNQLKNLLAEAVINLDVPIEKPPVCMYIYDNITETTVKKKRLFTLGNFSAITGKSKSKKTFLARMLLSAASIKTPIQNKFHGELPDNKCTVVYFDTEQALYDSYVTSKSIHRITEATPDNFIAFNLRKYSPIERIQIIEYYLQQFGHATGYMVIDGIVDLALAINDELEATKISTLLMNWTAVYNMHITVIIHQNKNDNYATGHIGSSIMKKSEAVIWVEADKNDKSMSKVGCDMIRGTEDFSDFMFHISEYGLPIITEWENNKEIKKPF